MNTLNGYSKSTLTDKYVLTAAGGHRYIYDSEFIIGTQTAATGSWTGVSIDSELYDGKQISYWLPFNGSGNATLNLTLAGGTTTGAVNCYYGGTSRLTTHYGAGNIIRLVYRKDVTIGSSTYTGWWADANYVDGNTYTSAWCGTSAGTAAKTASCSNFTLKANSYLHILVRYSNTAASAITLNVNSLGAKPIYINGAASSSSNYTLPAGTYLVFYDGTNFYFKTDNILPGNIEKSLTLSGWSDTRNDATYPQDYNGVFKIVGIKTAGTALGLTSSLVGSYAHIIGFRGWHNNTGGYAWEIATGSKNRLFVRSGDTTSWNNGWSTLAYTTDIPTVTDYYWANVKVSSSSKNDTKPTFALATATTSVETPLVLNTSGILTLNGKTNIYLKINNTDSQAINLAATYLKPFGSAKNLIDLGTSDARWKCVYSNTGNFSNTVYIQAAGGNYTEGIRLSGSAKDSTWSNILFGCDPAATSGTHANQWLLGRDNSNRFVVRNSTTDLLHIINTGLLKVLTNGAEFSGDVTLHAGNVDRFLNFKYNNGSTYGWRIGYLGSGSGDANYLVVQSSKAAGTSWSNVIRLGNETLDAAFGSNILLNSNKSVQKAGSSISWYLGRNNAIIKTTSYTGYNALVSMKTTDGDWSMGVYSNNVMYFTYITDTNYNAGTNTTTALVYINASGNVYATHFYEHSDINLKTNIKPITTSDNIPQLKSFDWKSDGSHSYGLIAQELEELGYSELVSNEGGLKTVKYSAALSLIVGKLQVKIKELEKEIENLKNKN